MVSKIVIEELKRFNELGLIVNKNFSNVYKLNDIILEELGIVVEDKKLLSKLVLELYKTNNYKE